MKRIVSFLVIASMAVILTGCEGEDPLETFTYTASAESGGTISPDGTVSITQGEGMTFTATPDNGKIVNEWSVNGSVVTMSGNSYTLTNVQSNGTIQVTFKDIFVHTWQLTPTMTATLDDKGVLTISTTKDAEDMPNPRWENLPEGGFSMFPFWITDEIDYRDMILTAVIEDKVTSIASMAFHFCTSLTSVTIPNSVTSIWAAFGGCHSLTSITIPNSVTYIGLTAFRESGLTSIVIPNSVTTIDGAAFMDCKALTSITIPNSVIEIGREAFANCTSLTSVTIPSSVTTLGSSIFSDCIGIKDVKVGWMTPPSNGLFNSLSIYSAATLYVPSGTKDLYQAANPWQYFGTIVEY